MNAHVAAYYNDLARRTLIDDLDSHNLALYYECKAILEEMP